MVPSAYFVRFLDTIPLGSKHVAWGCLSPVAYFNRFLIVWKERHNDSYFGLMINDIRFNLLSTSQEFLRKKYPYIFKVLSKEMQKGGVKKRVNLRLLKNQP